MVSAIKTPSFLGMIEDDIFAAMIRLRPAQPNALWKLLTVTMTSDFYRWSAQLFCQLLGNTVVAVPEWYVSDLLYASLYICSEI
jgi:hypothetical protein